ncbi:15566_t:CDS:1, partial [Acaulospora morrowiae]
MSRLFQIPECLRLIFVHLEHDRSSLHSCILVNRLWCMHCIDFLWRQPFHILYTCNKELCNCSLLKRYSQASNLLKTILSCLIRLNPALMQKEIISTSQSMPLFNYVRYMKSLEFHELNMAIQDWWLDYKAFARRDPPKAMDYLNQINVCRRDSPIPKIRGSTGRKDIISDGSECKRYVTKDCFAIILFLNTESESLSDHGPRLTSQDPIEFNMQVPSFDLSLNPKITCDRPAPENLCRRMAQVMCKTFMSGSRSIEQISFDSRFAAKSFGQQDSCYSNLYWHRNSGYRNSFFDDYLTFSNYPGSSVCLARLTKL